MATNGDDHGLPGPDELRALPIGDLRARRADAQALETGLSYLRRVVQGHLDIVGAELDRRAGGDDRHDASDLVEDLPAILAEGRAPEGPARPPATADLGGAMGTGEAPTDLRDRLDGLLAGGGLDDPTVLDDDALAALRDGLAEVERDASARRRDRFALVDALQDELARRYRDGEADVASLLHPD